MTNSLNSIQSFIYLVDDTPSTPNIATQIASSPEQLVILNEGANSPALNMAIANPNSSKIIVSYVDLTEAFAFAEPTLFSSGALPSWFGAENPSWPGIYSVQYWNSAWLTIIENRISQTISQGYNGIFLDVASSSEWTSGNVEGNPVNPNATADLSNLITEIRNYVNGLNLSQPFYIIANNPVELAESTPSTLSNLDAIFNETAYFLSSGVGGVSHAVPAPPTEVANDETGIWPVYSSAGIPVFGNDYPDTTNLSQDFQSFATYSAVGFIPSVDNAGDTENTLINGPYMFMATATNPIVMGAPNYVNFISGGLVTAASLTGGNQGDYFIGGPGQNTITGGSGNDTIYAHPASASLKGILKFYFINGDVNATTIPSIQISINGQVVGGSLPITQSYNTPGYQMQEVDVDTSQFGTINSLIIRGLNIYYSNSGNFNNVFLTSLTYQGQKITLNSAQINTGATLLSSGSEILFNNGGIATFGAAAFSAASPFPANTSDAINGGGGLNTVVYRGASRNFTIQAQTGGWLVSTSVTAEGPDTLTNVQKLTFADTSVFLPQHPLAGLVFSADKNSFMNDGLSEVLIESPAGNLVVGELAAGALAYTQVALVPAGWTFRAEGSFFGNGKSQALIENAAGTLVAVDVSSGAAVYTQVGNLPLGWNFDGAGNFFGAGVDSFLLENPFTNALVATTISTGQIQYTQIAVLPPGWLFEGVGDFNGDGKAQFLIKSVLGAVSIGEVGSNGLVSYSQISTLSNQWRFEGVGDFLGDGQDQFLLQDANGAVVLGEVGSNGQAAYTQIGSLGSQWLFKGVGDYAGSGVDSFLIQDSDTGALLTGTVASGQAQYAQVGTLASQWSFPLGPPASTVPAVDDLLGNGLSDILIENAAGALLVGELNGSGQMAYSQVYTLPSAWSFKAVGNFLNYGQDQFLIENSSGTVLSGQVAGGQASFSLVATLGSQYAFEGAGDFAGSGVDGFLLEDAGTGALLTGSLVSGEAQYTQIGALSSDWSFEGVGDYLGDGKDQFIIENSAGALVVGEVGSAGQVGYSQIGTLASGWTFEESGAFLGDGRDQFLIENGAGAVVAGEVGSNGQAAYSQIGALSHAWQFVGAGSYVGSAIESFLVENTASNAVLTGTVVNGQAQYAQVAALPAGWAFHG